MDYFLHQKIFLLSLTRICINTFIQDARLNLEDLNDSALTLWQLLSNQREA